MKNSPVASEGSAVSALEMKGVDNVDKRHDETDAGAGWLKNRMVATRHDGFEDEKPVIW